MVLTHTALNNVRVGPARSPPPLGLVQFFLVEHHHVWELVKQDAVAGQVQLHVLKALPPVGHRERLAAWYRRYIVRPPQDYYAKSPCSPSFGLEGPNHLIFWQRVQREG